MGFFLLNPSISVAVVFVSSGFSLAVPSEPFGPPWGVLFPPRVVCYLWNGRSLVFKAKKRQNPKTKGRRAQPESPAAMAPKKAERAI